MNDNIDNGISTTHPSQSDSSINIVRLGRRILIIAQDIPVPADRYIWSQALQLTRNGYIVSVISPKGAGCETAYEERDEIFLFRYSPSSPARTPAGRMIATLATFAWKFILACRVFFTHGCDALQICNPPDMSYLIGGFFKLFFNKKFIFLQSVDTPQQYEGSHYHRGTAYNWLIRMEGQALAAANAILVRDAFLQQNMANRHRLNPKKIFLVPAFTNLPPGTTATKRPGEILLVLCDGTYGSRNQMERFVEAARIIVQEIKRRDIMFLAICPEHYLADIQKFINTEELSDFVTLRPPAIGQASEKVISQADLCISFDPVDYTNGYSSTAEILSSMAGGRPIIVGDTPEARVLAGDAAIYASQYDTDAFVDALLSLADDLDKREQMGSIGPGRAAALHTQNTSEIIAAYTQLFKPA